MDNSTNESKALFCPVCGAEMTENQRFCSSCGFDSAKKDSTEELVTTEENLPEKTESKPKKDKSNSFFAKLLDSSSQGAGLGAISVILSIIIFIAALAAVASKEAGNFVSDDGIEELISSVDVSDIKLSDFGMKSNDSIAESLSKRLSNRYEGYEVLDEKKFEKYLDRDELKDFIADEVNDIVEDIYTGDDRASVKASEIQEMLVDGYYFLQSEYGIYSPNTYFYEDITTWIFNSLHLDEINAEYVKDEYPAVYYAISVGCSDFFVGLMAILALVFVILLWKVKGWSIVRLMRPVGIVFVIIGAVMMLPSIFAEFLPSLWSSMLGGMFIAEHVGSVFLKINFELNLAIFVIGIALLVARAILALVANKLIKK